MEDIIKINEEERKYYNKCYKVYMWTGAGYWTQCFKVYANYEQQAIELIVSYAEDNYKSVLIDAEDVEEEEESLYSYIDATEYGATKPYYIYNENLRIEEIE